MNNYCVWCGKKIPAGRGAWVYAAERAACLDFCIDRVQELRIERSDTAPHRKRSKKEILALIEKERPKDFVSDLRKEMGLC